MCVALNISDSSDTNGMQIYYFQLVIEIDGDYDFIPEYLEGHLEIKRGESKGLYHIV